MAFAASRYSTGKSLDQKKEMVDSVKLENLIHIHKWPSDKRWHIYRLVGGVMSYAFWWVPFKKKDGSITNIPKQALGWNVDEEVDDSSIPCPYRELARQLAPLFPDQGKERHRNAPKLQAHFYINAIPREVQEDFNPERNKMNEGEKESGYKDFTNDKSRTPFEVLKLPPGAAVKVSGLKALNLQKKDGVMQPVAVSDPELGCDVAIMFDDTKKGAAMYEFNCRSLAPLTDEEQGYLIYKLDGLLEPEDLQTATREARKIGDSHGTSPNAGGFSRANTGDDFDSGDKANGKGGGDKEERPASRRADLNEDFDAPARPAGRPIQPAAEPEPQSSRARSAEPQNEAAMDDAPAAAKPASTPPTKPAAAKRDDFDL